MFISNKDPHPAIDLDYLGLRITKKYWFPHYCKYVAWFLVLGISVTASAILIYYGMSFGMVKTYLWLTAIGLSFILGILLITPLKIFALILFDAIFLKKTVLVLQRRILPDDLTNAENPEEKEKILKMRKYNAKLYKPIPLHRLQNRLEDIKYNIELRNLTVDTIAYIIFMITIFYVVLVNKTSMQYTSTEVSKNLVVRGSYTNSIPFTEVVTYDTFLEYLNETFIPALTLNYRDYMKARSLRRSLQEEDFSKKRKKRKVRSSREDRTPVNSIRKRQVINNYDNLFDDQKKNKTDIFDLGWTMDPAVKLIGKPRLRQVRVQSDSCKQDPRLEGRNLECASELNLFNEDRGNYTLGWEPYSEMSNSPQVSMPWIYQTGWQTKTMPIYAKFSFYPAGGYVLELAKNVEDARIILEFMDTFQWVDVRTRAIFLEFTTYCVNNNIFNIVTLIAERSATGYIIPSFQIETCKLMFTVVEVEFFTIIIITLFAVLLFFFLLREALRIHRTSFKQYIKRAFAMLDLTIIFLGVISILFIILRSYYVSSLLWELQQGNNNIFVSFFYAGYWDAVSVYIEALLVCLAFLKIFRLLTFRVLFYQLQTALNCCYRNFLSLVCQIFILIIAFSMLFHLILMSHAYEFSSLALSISTMIGRTVFLEDLDFNDIFKSTPKFLAPIFFAIFVVVISIIFVNLFIAVICLYFHEIRKFPLVNKYRIMNYIKHVLTSDHRSDIIHLRGDNKIIGEENSRVLRLKGGWDKSSKVEEVDKTSENKKVLHKYKKIVQDGLNIKENNFTVMKLKRNLNKSLNKSIKTINKIKSGEQINKEVRTKRNMKVSHKTLKKQSTNVLRQKIAENSPKVTNYDKIKKIGKRSNKDNQIVKKLNVRRLNKFSTVWKIRNITTLKPKKSESSIVTRVLKSEKNNQVVDKEKHLKEVKIAQFKEVNGDCNTSKNQNLTVLSLKELESKSSNNSETNKNYKRSYQEMEILQNIKPKLDTITNESFITRGQLHEQINIHKIQKNSHKQTEEEMGKQLNNDTILEEQNSTVLRLRGGGNKNSKGKKNSKTKEKKTESEKESEEESEEEEIERINVKNFVYKNPYDVTKYLDLPNERDLAMKHLTKAILIEDPEIKKIERQKALMALFISFTCESKKFMEGESSEKYFMAEHDSIVEVFNRKRLTEMKKVVKKFGKENDWVFDEQDLQDFSYDLDKVNKKLRVLNKKLDALLKKQH